MMKYICRIPHRKSGLPFRTDMTQERIIAEEILTGGIWSVFGGAIFKVSLPLKRLEDGDHYEI